MTHVAPLAEEERPELDGHTNALLRQYQKSPTEEYGIIVIDDAIKRSLQRATAIIIELFESPVGNPTGKYG